MYQEHIPVLAAAASELLTPAPSQTVVDLTAGGGGHSALLLASLSSTGRAILVDRDVAAIKLLRRKFGHDQRVTIWQANFAEAANKLPDGLDRVLLDLGTSAMQLGDPSRGFSFASNGPLDMRMDQRETTTAAKLVNTLPEAELRDLLYAYGEEPRAKRIARAIVEARANQPITMTAQLAEIVAKVTPRQGKIHPATKTFQALRIAVNDELNALAQTLPIITRKLTKGGRLAVISFHSLEDRIVKQFFRSLTTVERDQYGQLVHEPDYKLVTKKPIKGETETDLNPRSRSARLRCVEKII